LTLPAPVAESESSNPGGLELQYRTVAQGVPHWLSSPLDRRSSAIVDW